jgi:integrase/recombinase XerD
MGYLIMALSKQAKILSKQQIDAVLAYLSKTRYPLRNRVIFLLSVRAGLRAKEIGHLTWSMVLNSDGTLSEEIALQDCAAKGSSGRIVPMAKDLKAAMTAWRAECGAFDEKSRLISTERAVETSAQAIVNMFSDWYRSLGFSGCSSHSGRRTFITNAARKISTVGGSLRDVQALAGHSSLTTTERYIEVNAEAKRKIVEIA